MLRLYRYMSLLSNSGVSGVKISMVICTRSGNYVTRAVYSMHTGKKGITEQRGNESVS